MAQQNSDLLKMLSGRLSISHDKNTKAEKMCRRGKNTELLSRTKSRKKHVRLLDCDQSTNQLTDCMMQSCRDCLCYVGKFNSSPLTRWDYFFRAATSSVGQTLVSASMPVSSSSSFSTITVLSKWPLDTSRTIVAPHITECESPEMRKKKP